MPSNLLLNNNDIQMRYLTTALYPLKSVQVTF